jgi:hypothetical protein
MDYAQAMARLRLAITKVPWGRAGCMAWPMSAFRKHCGRIAACPGDSG